MADAPYMIMIAGPNGAGKSTFYKQILSKDPFFEKVEFINLDNLAKEMAGENEDPNNFMLPAAKIISERLTKKIKKKKSFIYETTSAGVTHLKIMQAAKNKGFKITTIFIGLSSAELSHLRVQQRVTEGGHNVPPEDIERRYPKIIKNFPEMLKISDISAVFDNSGKNPFKLIFLMDESKFWIFHRYPKWLNKSLEERKTQKDMIHITNKAFKSMPAEKSATLIKCIFQQLNRE